MPPPRPPTRCPAQRGIFHGGIAVKLPAEQYSTVSATRTATGEVEIIHDGDVATDNAAVPNE